MNIFDGLPEIVRNALQDTGVKVDATSARGLLDKGFAPKTVARMIRDAVQRYVNETHERAYPNVGNLPKRNVSH